MARCLLPAALALCFLGIGCLVTAKKIPPDAKPIFDGYVTAIRNADLSTIDRLLCANLNHQAILNLYQTMLEADRVALADTLAATLPEDSSTETRLTFQAQPSPVYGSPYYRYTLTKSGTSWCIED